MSAMTAAGVHSALNAANSGDITTLVRLSESLNFSECCDKYGASLVHYAVRGGKVDCLRWLVMTAGLSGSKPANNGATPAHDAAATGQLDCLQWLVQNSVCQPNAKDTGGTTPLHLAARFDHLPIVVWLVEAENCSVTEKAQNGITPVHLAAAKGSLKCLRWMTQHDPSCVNKRADNGTTPVYFAAQEGRLECIQFLVNQVEANFRLRANDGMAPIHAAAQMGQLGCVAWLISNAGVSLMERDNDGATPLHFAAAKGHVEVMKWLLTNGATIEKDDLGGTPLHDAAESGSIEAIQILLTIPGINKDDHDEDGMTAADLAKDCGHVRCAEFIQNYKPPPPTLATLITEQSVAKSSNSSVSMLKTDSSKENKILPRKLSFSSDQMDNMPPKRETEHQIVSSPTGQPTSSNGMAQVGPFLSSKIISTTPNENAFQKVEFPKLKPVILNAVEKKTEASSADNELNAVFTRRSSTGQSYLESSEEPTEGCKNYRTQSSELMSEVREFEPSGLKTVPVQAQKRNLQPIILGHVKTSPVAKEVTEVVKKEDRKEQVPSQVASTESNPHAHLPPWKQAMIRKKSLEQERILQEEKNKEDTEKNKWADVPAWKRAIVEKKESERKKKEEQEAACRKQEEVAKLQFESLPEWKKQLILQHKKH